MNKTPRVRERMRGDRRWMDRARRKYVMRANRWLEEDRTRLRRLANRMIELQLYAESSGERMVGFSIVGILFWRWRQPRETWHEFTKRTGWALILWPNGRGSWRLVA